MEIFISTRADLQNQMKLTDHSVEVRYVMGFRELFRFSASMRAKKWLFRFFLSEIFTLPIIYI